MRECVLYLACIFSYKDLVEDSVLIRKNTGQIKPVLWHILRSISLQKELKIKFVLYSKKGDTEANFKNMSLYVGHTSFISHTLMADFYVFLRIILSRWIKFN